MRGNCGCVSSNFLFLSLMKAITPLAQRVTGLLSLQADCEMTNGRRVSMPPLTALLKVSTEARRLALLVNPSIF